MNPTHENRLDADTLLAFYERCGFCVHRSARGWWYQAGPRFFLAVPTHRPISVDEDEAAGILKKTKALGLRYVCSTSNQAQPSWRMVLDIPDYGLENLSSNTRSKIRRGLKQNTIRRISGADLKRHGKQAFIDTVSRQGRGDRYGLERWHRLLDAADQIPGIEIWSAWHEDELSAYLLIMVFDDACEFYEARSRNDLLRTYPNNALIYTVAHELLTERRVPRITFGIEGLEELDSLDQFKLTMGFTKEPIEQCVVFHRTLRAALAIRPLRSIVARIAGRPKATSFWRRADSLVKMAGFERD